MRLIDKIKEHPTAASILIFLSIIGPGVITGSVDNDAGGITTYSVAGALYGYGLLWTLIPSFVILLVVQEMNARMGMVTGKGLADLIRENFGVRITFLIFIGLIIADIGNTATELAGVAGSMAILGITKYLSVPIVSAMVLILVIKGNYKTAERIFLFFSVCLLSYIISAVLAKPDITEITTALTHPLMRFDAQYLAMVLGIVGTTIAPWMQFYMQSAIIEKRVRIDEYKYAFWDVVLGCTATVVVAFFIIVACAATLNKNGVTITEAKDAAMALKPFAGALASYVFAFGLFIASLFSAIILPLATAFYVCEAFGFEAGINKKFHEAPQFYSLLAFIIAAASVVILIPNAPLITITISSQILNAVLLPIVLLSMITLVNNKKIMGVHTNNRLQNAIGVAAIVILVVLTIMLIWTNAMQLIGK